MQWLLNLLARWFVNKAVDPDHVVTQPPEPEDWQWNTPDAEYIERVTVTGSVDSAKEVSQVFRNFYPVFDRGFGESQVEIIENISERLKPGEIRNFNYTARRDGKPEPLDIVIARTDLNSIGIQIQLAKEVANKALKRIKFSGFSIIE